MKGIAMRSQPTSSLLSYGSPVLSLLQFSFAHGTFEKVNYLGYDDHVVLNRSISFLRGEDMRGGDDLPAAKIRRSSARMGAGVDHHEEGVETIDDGDGKGGKLLTILTVRPWCRPHSCGCVLRAW